MNTLNTFDEFLKEIETLKHNGSLAKDRKKVVIDVFNGVTNRLKCTIDHAKLKNKIAVNGIVVNTEFLDSINDNDLLESFFGSNDIVENEKKLKELEKAIKEV